MNYEFNLALVALIEKHSATNHAGALGMEMIKIAASLMASTISAPVTVIAGSIGISIIAGINDLNGDEAAIEYARALNRYFYQQFTNKS